MPELADLARVVVSAILTYSLAATAAVLAMLALHRFMSHAVADVAWKVALVGPLVFALALVLLPVVPHAVEYALPEQASLDLSGLAAYGFSADAGSGADTLPAGPKESAVPPALSFNWPVIVFALWIAAAAAGLLLYARDWRQFLRRLAGRTPVDGQVAQHLTHELPLRSVRLSAAPGLISPCAIGGREIILPSTLLMQGDGADLRGAVAHEAAHLLRRDPFWLMAWRILECLFFFLPWLRLARRRHMESAEYLCDAWAIRHLGSPDELVRSLVATARNVVSDEVRLAPGMAVRRRVLLDRVTRALEGSVHLPARGRLLLASLAAVVAFGCIGMVTPVFSFMLQEQDRPKAVKPAKKTKRVTPPARVARGTAPTAPLPQTQTVPGRPMTEPDSAPLPEERPMPPVAEVAPADELMPAEEPSPATMPVTAVAPAARGENTIMTPEEAEAVLLGTQARATSRPKPPKAPKAERRQESFLIEYRPLIESIFADGFENRKNDLPTDKTKNDTWSGNIHEIFDSGSEYGVRFSNLRLSDDDRFIRSLGQGGVFRIETLIDHVRRCVEIHPTEDGGFRRVYLVNGNPQILTSDVRRQFLAGLDRLASEK